MGLQLTLIFFFSLCRFNYLRLSYILEKVLDMLTLLFYRCYSIKCGKEWSKSFGKSLCEKDSKRYNKDQKELIESGQVEKWDITLLCEILLHSSYCFLVNSSVSLEVQCVTEGCKAAENCKNNKHKSNILKFESPSDSVDLSNFKILLRQHDLMHLTIASVQGLEGITVKQSLPPGRCAVYYLCSENWVAVCQLRDIRNEFAHMKKYQISEQDLMVKVQRIKDACQSFKNTSGENFDEIASEIEIIFSSMSMMILLYQ